MDTDVAGVAQHEVRRAVDGIDDPTDARWCRCRGTALLAEDAVVGSSAIRDTTMSASRHRPRSRDPMRDDLPRCESVAAPVELEIGAPGRLRRQTGAAVASGPGVAGLRSRRGLSAAGIAASRRSLVHGLPFVHGTQHEHGDHGDTDGTDDGADEPAEPGQCGAAVLALEIGERTADEPAAQTRRSTMDEKASEAACRRGPTADAAAHGGGGSGARASMRSGGRRRPGLACSVPVVGRTGRRRCRP